MPEEKTLRQRYLSNEITHREYYGGIVEEIGISLPEHMQKAVVHSTDPHFNDIGLVNWDRLSCSPLPFYWGKAFRSRGDCPTPAGLVCVWKECAMRYLESVQTTPEFWDCECEKDYIHPKSVATCPQCGATKDSQSDSRVNEVARKI